MNYEEEFDEFPRTKLVASCYETHPALKVGKGKLIGGNAGSPILKTADVYVSLQAGSTSGLASDPWDDQAVVEVRYTIQDMHAPANVPRFKKLVTWIGTQLHDGKTVHVGCIGGHGRSGMLISAIVAEALGKKDAIQWVRKHYCKKAVESKAQVDFLIKHYGVSETAPAKPSYTSVGGASEWATGGTYQDTRSSSKGRPEGVSAADKSFSPMSSGRSLWKPKKKTH